MAWKACAGNHTWEPLLNWFGRYKCRDCWVLGYRGTVLIDSTGADRFLGLTGPIRGKARDIVPYHCPKCKGPTTGHSKGKATPCPTCR